MVAENAIAWRVDKNGKISRQEYMDSIATEFDRLKKDRAANSTLKN
jgi:hypothetical protein